MRQQKRTVLIASSVLIVLGILSGLGVMAIRPENSGGKPRPSVLENWLERLGFEDEAEREREAFERERVFALSSQAVEAEGPISAEAEAFGITPPLRDNPAFQEGPPPPDRIQIKEEENNEVEVERVTPTARHDETPFTDKLAEKSRATTKANAPLAMPGAALSFDGIISNNLLNSFGTTAMPPDTNGDVGPNHYVQTTNFGVFRVFDKSGNAVGATMRISSLFSGLPANNKCRLRDNGDPVVVYDQLADRWLITQFAIGDDGDDASSPYYQCMAVSQTGDPTGAYYAYAFRAPNSNFPDYPHWAVWTDGYYLATHEFNDAGTAYAQAGFFAFNRDKIIQGDPTANYVYFSRTTTFGQLPADIEGYVPPAAGTPEMFFEFTADEYGLSDGVLPYEFVPNFVTPASSTFTAKTLVSVSAFDPREPTGRLDVEQPSPAINTNNLDAVGNRLMHRVAYRNLGTSGSPVHSYVMNWTVNVSGVNPTGASTYQAGVRWEELRRSVAGVISVFDQGTHAPDTASGSGRNRWMGSIAQDSAGNIALGFTRSGPNSGENPDIVWAGRSGGSVAAGTMNEGEAVMFASSGVQQSGSSRWGDYSSMNVDPADDCTFWYTQEYRDSAYNGTLNNNPFKWNTRVGTFKFSGCSAAPKGQLAVNVTSCSTSAAINGALVKVSPGGFIRLTGASGALASNISLAPGTYSITVTKGGLTATQNNVVVSNGATATANICLTGSALAVATAPFNFESCSTNSLAEPGELVTVNLGLQNVAGANTSNLTATLQASGGVTSPSAAQNYGVVTAGGSTVSRAFTFVVDPTQACGKPLTLTLALADGATNLGNITYSLPTCTTAGSAQNFDYAGGAVAIPDNSATGVSTTVNVSNVAGVIQDLNFQLTGSSATTGSAGVDHSWIGDLSFRLTSPSGTTVTLIRQVDSVGGSDGACSNTNFFNTILDDEAGSQIDNNGCGAGNGISGSYKPANALSLFDGENPNGTWTLNVSDTAAGDTGTLRNFRLVITPYTFVSSCATSIVTPPSNVTVASGGTATFNVVANGRNLHFQWRKNTTNISGAPDSPTYTIPSVTSGNMGSYDVVVTGSNGSPVTSNAATLTVTGGNTTPGITAGSALSRQQGSAGSGSTIATVSDAETAAGSLSVTATTVPAGLTVTSITNTNGTITANVAAACNATVGANTVVLTVSDGAATATANLTVNVTANAAPVLGNYSNTVLTAGTGTTVTPSATPTDNGSVASVTAAASAGFTGSLSANTGTGVVTISNAGPAGTYTITVTATDNCGTTATKTFTLTVNATNTAPTITAGSALSRQQGSAGSGSTIATVSDGQTAAGSLTVTATTVPAGLTVTGITNTSGTITATVAAACNATVGANTVVLTVSDGSLTATANLTVNVTANAAPVLGNYSNTTINTGAGTTVTPSAAPTDNGSVASVTAVASAGFTGTLSGNATTGVITITNAGPTGTYTITVTATDNCGTTAAKPFTLTVNAVNTPPTITAGSALSRQQGSAGSNSTIATVSDAQSAAGSLTVTATTVPAGLTVTSITNTSGTITATVAAACNATVGANTVVLNVSDGTASATANLTVNVTANSAPVQGTYANTLVNAGAGTTVTPSAAPTDNGSLAGLTVAASAGFTGSLSVNNNTGEVTVSNAGPTGTYTITVTATDNCNATSTRTFTLTVSVPPVPVCAPAPSGLVAWYRGENNANDTAGSFHGTLQGLLGFVAGQVGRAFNFDGTDDSVKITAASALNVGSGSGLTLAAWVKPGDLTTRRPLFEWNNNSISGAHLWANVNCTANCTDTAGALYANLLDTSGGNHILQTGANVLNASAFQYVVLTYDKTTGVAQLYRNGVSVASQNLGSFTPRTDYDLYLGFRPAGNGVTRFVGQLDEADVYNRALNSTEVQALFNAGSTGKCLTPNCGTLAYSTGFDSTVGSEWTQTKTDLTPTGSRRFLGQFGNETARLSLNSLAAHTSVTVSFDLYLLRSWDGHTTSAGPDVFKLAINGGATLVNSSFSNLPSGFSGNIQSYPDVYPGGSYPSYTGATETTTLGYTATVDGFTYAMDSVYRITKTFNHTGASLQLDFSALGLEALANESWGLDNVAVLLDCSGGANTPPTITAGSAVARQQGSAGSSATIATVSDAQTSAGGLFVSATTVPTGLSVTNITNTSGTITAIVAAACNATVGANTVVLTVTDGNGATATANLTVNVAANSLPTLGTYSAASVASGGSTTVSPSVPPADNGSLNSLTASAPGFTGSLTANLVTGVVTVANAGPAGTFTVTVTATDNCGATAAQTFALTVTAGGGGGGSCATTPANLAAWYRGENNGNDTQGGAAATLTNVTFAAGKVGQAFNLNGTSAFVGIPSRNLASAYSVEFWVNPARSSGYQHLVSNDFRSPNFGALYQFGNKLSYWANNKHIFDSTATLTLNQWAHVVLTYDGAQAKLYVNGVLDKTGSMAGLTLNTALRLGDGLFRDSSSLFQGLLDEASFYGRTLTAAEAQALFNAGSNGKCGVNTPPTITAASALARQQGSPAGAPLSLATVSDGQTAAGALTVTATTVPAGLTVTGLTNTNGLITGQVTAACNATVGANTVVLTVSDGAATATANLTVNVTANTPPTLGTYANTAVFVGSGTTVTPSAAPSDNGTLASVTVSGATGLTINAATGVVTVPNNLAANSYTVTVTATDNCGATATRTFTLTVNVACLTAPANLAAWYRGEGNGTDAKGGTAATLTNVTFAAGKIGQAFNLNGTSAFGAVPSRNLASAYSVEFWLNPARSSGYQHVVSNDYRSPNFGALYQSGGKLSYWANGKVVFDSAATLTLGQWTHVVLTYDGTQAKLYVNGVLDKTANVSGLTFNTALRLGDGLFRDSSSLFQGALDEVSFYGRALTAAEALALFNANGGKC